MLKIVSCFHILEEEDDNKKFYREILRDDLFSTISCFKRDKSPNLDGLNVNFYKYIF
jgi:hypothetical protein